MIHTPVGGIADPRFFPSHDPAFASLPFSEAVQLGHLLFVSGQIGNAPGAITLVPGGIAAESKQALDNIRTILTRHGSALEHAVKFTVFLADMQEWSAFNTVYREFFSGRFPSRSALAAKELILGARVELECIAYVP